MSDSPLFDIYGFDENLLDIPALVAHAYEFSQTPTETASDDWQITTIVDNEDRLIMRFDPTDGQTYPSLKFTHYRQNKDLGQRTFNILQALQDFGVSTAARPFYTNANEENFAGSVLICEWIAGNALQKPPSPDEEEMWHRIMATLGFQKNLPFGKYASVIPMAGYGIQNPSDLLAWLDTALANLNETVPNYAELAELVDSAHEKIHPTWHMMPKIGISRLDAAIDHLIWDGHHLRVTGWSKTDWADVAFDIAQMAADPDYEDLPLSHWVWFRWEYARLSHDEGTVSRATTYTQILHLYWALKLTQRAATIDDEKAQRKLMKQRDRYLQKARKSFA